MQLNTRFICFVGVDGSGKSTLIKMLIDDLNSKGFEVSYLWLRMNYFFTRPVLLICRVLGLTRRPIINKKKISVHEFYKSPFIAWLVRILHTFDTFIYFLFKIYLPLKFTKKIIVCDRFVYDIFIDFAVEGKKGNIFESPLFAIANKMMNKAQVFLIHVEKDKILNRRPNVRDYDPDYDLRYSIYEELKSNPKVKVIENDSGIEATYRVISLNLFN